MSERQFATFYLDDLLLGIDILAVREINRHLDLTNVHLMKDYVCGMLNLRGQIITMLDLGVKLGLKPREITPESRGIILKTQQEIDTKTFEALAEEELGSDHVGLLVDRVGDVVTVDAGEIDPPPANIGEISGQYLSGVIRLEDKLLSILKITPITV